MNLYVFYVQTSFLFIFSASFTKSLPIIARDADLETYSDLENSFKSNNLEAIHASNTRSAKHGKEPTHGKVHRERREDDISNYLNKQCAVMYKNDEPVGILQPYKDKYQLLPVNKEDVIPVEISLLQGAAEDLITAQKREAKEDPKQANDHKSDTDTNVDKSAEISAYADERYPHIFAKFKIDSRVDKDNNRIKNSMQKREAKAKVKKPPLFSDEDNNSLKSSLLKLETGAEGAELALKDVLSDLGLIDEPNVKKRSADSENGNNPAPEANKNNIIEITNDEQPLASKPKKKRTAIKYKEPTFPAPKGMSDDEFYDKYIDAHPEIFEQSVNEESNKEDSAEHHEAKRAHKENEEKHSESKEEKKREANQKSSEELEERVASQINSKLQSIKEQVRNEIEMLNKAKDVEYVHEPQDSEDQEEKSQRLKRNIMVSLVDQESDDLNPVLAENNLEPHIRRRKSLMDVYFDERNNDDDEDRSFEIREIKVNQDESDKDIDHIDPLAEEVPSSASSSDVRNKDDTSLIIDLLDKSTQNSDKGSSGGLSSGNGKDVRNSKDPESTDPTQHCLTTTEPSFHLRSLKEFDYDSEEHDRQTRSDSCKCIGQKSCKCSHLHHHPKPEKISLLSDDGSPVVYLDDSLMEIPREAMLGYAKQRFSDEPHKKPAKHHKRRQRQSGNMLKDGAYTLDLEPDTYRLTEAHDQSRRKRDNFLDLVQIHGGEPAMNHLVAVRERSMFPSRKRRKRNSDLLTLNGMSEEDLFGALPQTYGGELARVKRIRRR